MTLQDQGRPEIEANTVEMETPAYEAKAALILIVDDDALIRTILLRIARREGYRVAEAENARQAIAQIERDAPDLILCDIYMPEADGFELINWLREEKRVIPTIAMSGTAGVLQDQLSLAGKLGATAILAKPFDPYDVSVAIANALPPPV